MPGYVEETSFKVSKYLLSKEAHHHHRLILLKTFFDGSCFPFFSTESLDAIVAKQTDEAKIPHEELLQDTRYQPGNQAQINAQIQFLFDEIATFRELDQRVIDLVINGDSNQQIADLLDIPIGTVKKIKQKVRKILLQKLIQMEREKEREIINVF